MKKLRMENVTLKRKYSEPQDEIETLRRYKNSVNKTVKSRDMEIRRAEVDKLELSSAKLSTWG